MPSVFTDSSGDYDLIIPTPTDWTVSGGSLPNGDASVSGDGSVAPAYNLAAEDFNLASGAWSIEFWVYMTTTPTITHWILINHVPGIVAESWSVGLDTSRIVTFRAITTPLDTTYMSRSSAALSTGAWHHVVFNIPSAGTPVCYVDNALSSSASSARSGTARVPSAASRLTTGDNFETMTRLAKVAIDDRELTVDEIDEDYLAMTS